MDQLYVYGSCTQNRTSPELVDVTCSLERWQRPRGSFCRRRLTWEVENVRRRLTDACCTPPSVHRRPSTLRPLGRAPTVYKHITLQRQQPHRHKLPPFLIDTARCNLVQVSASYLLILLTYSLFYTHTAALQYGNKKNKPAHLGRWTRSRCVVSDWSASMSSTSESSSLHLTQQSPIHVSCYVNSYWRCSSDYCMFYSLCEILTNVVLRRNE